MRSEIILSVFLLLSFTACKGQERNPYADAEPVRIHRFDKALFRLIETNDTTLQPGLLREYPGMLDVTGKAVLNMKSTDMPGFFERLRQYYSEPSLKKLYRESIAAYDSVGAIEKQLGVGFAYLKASLPSMTIPQVYMHVSGFSQNVLAAENLLSLSIDKYLGKDYPLYQNFFYDYQKEKMQPQNVVPDYLSGWLMSEYPFSGKDNVLLERMVYEGKIKYLVSHALPDVDPEVFMGYTKEQSDWCKANEGALWKTLIEQKHLYTPDHMVTNRYFEETPDNPLSHDAPGNLGTWFGWQIVNAYMKETHATPEALMQQTDAQEILTTSRYKPF